MWWRVVTINTWRNHCPTIEVFSARAERLIKNGAESWPRRSSQRSSRTPRLLPTSLPYYSRLHQHTSPTVTRAVEAVEYQTCEIDGVVWARATRPNQPMVGVSPQTVSNTLMQAGARICVSLYGRGSMTCVLASPCILSRAQTSTRQDEGSWNASASAAKPLFLDTGGLALRRLY